MNITVVIVNWNTGKLLSDCLASLATLPETSLISEIIVVDNHSHDRSFSDAKKVPLTTPVTFMGLPSNTGFAAANNFAIRQRRDKNSHVLLLNPDTKVLPGALASMQEVLEADSQRGIVGPMLQEVNGSIQPSVRNFPTLATFFLFFLKLQRFFLQSTTMKHYLLPSFDYTQEQEVQQVMGAAFLIHHDLLEAIGLLDEKFWIWFEEVDYCKRAITAGWKVVYTPHASVIHYGGVSFHQLVGVKKTLPFLRSCLHYASKHLSPFAYLCLLFLWPVATVLSLPASLLHLAIRDRNKTRL